MAVTEIEQRRSDELVVVATVRQVTGGSRQIERALAPGPYRVRYRELPCLTDDCRRVGPPAAECSAEVEVARDEATSVKVRRRQSGSCRIVVPDP